MQKNNYMYGKETRDLISKDYIKTSDEAQMITDILDNAFFCVSTSYPSIAFKNEKHREYVYNLLRSRALDIMTEQNQLNGDYD